jgi:hypothetical protein
MQEKKKKNGASWENEFGTKVAKNGFPGNERGGRTDWSCLIPTSIIQSGPGGFGLREGHAIAKRKDKR